MQQPNLKQYRHLMKSKNDLLFLLDTDYVFRDVYTHSTEMLAMPSDSFLNKRLEDIFPVDTAREMRDAMDMLQNPGKGQSASFHYDLTLQGRIRHFSAELSGVPDGEGNCLLLAVVSEVPAHNTHSDFFGLGLDLMCVADRESRFVRCNAAWTAQMGYREDELTGRSVLDFVHPEDRKHTTHILDRLFRTGQYRGFVNRYRKKDGQWCWLEWNACYNDGYYYGSARDITAQMSLESRLRASEMNFRSFFDTLDNMVAVLDTEGHILYVNDALLNCLGYKVSDLAGSFFFDLMGAALPARPIPVMETMLSDRRTALSTLRTSKGEYLICEIQIWKGQWNGETGIFVLSRDVTELLKQEKSMNRLTSIQNVLMDLATGFINMPLDQVEQGIRDSLEMMGRFVSADRVYIFDYDYGKKTTSNIYEWCGEGIEPQIELLQDIPMENISVWLNAHLEGREILIERLEDYHEDDDTKELLEMQGVKSLLTVPMMQGEHCLGFVGFDSVQDYKVYSADEIRLLHLYAQLLVNLRNRQSQEILLKNSLEEKNVLMKEIHHRVKNNLQIVSSLLNIQANTVSDPETRQALMDSQQRIRAMALLHENIYQTNDLSGFSFKEYVESIISYLAGQTAHQEQTPIVTDIADIHLEPDRAIPCGLIINELVTNSLRHAFTDRSPGTIWVSLRESGGQVSLTIRDDGVGFQGDDRVKSGSFGLTLVESLVRQLKGTLHMEGKEGSVITVMFSRKRGKEL